MIPIRSARDTVLVVDDSTETVAMLTDVLEDAGLTVLAALEGDQALAAIEKVTPDIILMDAVMPGMDGFETTRRLKRLIAAAHVPVIFMTGLTDTTHIVMGFDAGGVDYVAKPIVPDELIARIRTHLANARLARTAYEALDALGRYHLATDHCGRILWCTPQANALMCAMLPDFKMRNFILPDMVRSWLNQCNGADVANNAPITLSCDGLSQVQFSYDGEIGHNEILLRVSKYIVCKEEMVLQDKLSLTSREAEVLMWTARGKSNRDIGEILKMSPRTVNKHLEQIYPKLGVENRTAAAAIAMRAMGA
jgi:DNA-binding response OmpR family regulator/DNA-binding CsgD family transcriptional regulator